MLTELNQNELCSLLINVNLCVDVFLHNDSHLFAAQGKLVRFLASLPNFVQNTNFYYFLSFFLVGYVNFSAEQLPIDDLRLNCLR